MHELHLLFCLLSERSVISGDVRVSGVAQICNLPYRRFAIGWSVELSTSPALSWASQNTILRYGRLETCATITCGDICLALIFSLRSRGRAPRVCRDGRAC